MVLGIHIKKKKDKRKSLGITGSWQFHVLVTGSISELSKMTKFVVIVLGFLGHNIAKGDVATQVFSLSSCSENLDTLSPHSTKGLELTGFYWEFLFRT